MLGTTIDLLDNPTDLFGITRSRLQETTELLVQDPFKCAPTSDNLVPVFDLFAPNRSTMITLDLHRLCEIKGITHPHAFLTAKGISHRTATTMLNGKGKGLRFAHLEKLCRIYHCMPHELFNYKPAGRGIDPSNDVLSPLRKAPLKTQGLNSLIASLPPDEIIHLSEEIQARYHKPSEPTEDLQPKDP